MRLIRVLNVDGNEEVVRADVVESVVMGTYRPPTTNPAPTMPAYLQYDPAVETAVERMSRYTREMGGSSEELFKFGWLNLIGGRKIGFGAMDESEKFLSAWQ